MIVGNVGRNPEMRYTPTGKPVTSFSVATSRSWTSSAGEPREETEWFNVVAWNQLAEICSQYLKKSQQVYVEGRLQTRKWQDSNNNRRTSIEIIASEVIMLDRRRNTDDQNEFTDIEDNFIEDDSPF